MGICGFPMSFFGKTIGDHSVSVKPASLMWSAAVLWTLSLEGPPLLRCASPEKTFHRHHAAGEVEVKGLDFGGAVSYSWCFRKSGDHSGPPPTLTSHWFCRCSDREDNELYGDPLRASYDAKLVEPATRLLVHHSGRFG